MRPVSLIKDRGSEDDDEHEDDSLKFGIYATELSARRPRRRG